MITLEVISALDWLIMASFAILAISKDVRSACLTFLFGFLIYWVLIYPENGEMYYHLAAWLNLGIGWVVIKKHFVVGLLAFLLIPTNVIGFLLYDNNYESTFYYNISLTIILLMILTLTLRSLHGIYTRSARFRVRKNPLGLLVLWIVNADSMDKNKTSVEKVS